jgi:hypothetical protein
VISNKLVLRVILILLSIAIGFIAFSLVIPDYIPQAYYTTFFMVMGGSSAVIALTKLAKGSSTDDLLDCLNSKETMNLINRVDKLKRSNGTDEIFKNMKELCEKIKDDL